MRKIIEKQLKFNQLDISSIELVLRLRDEIPQLLASLQARVVFGFFCRIEHGLYGE